MPTSGAERQRLYRARRDADPEKRAQYLERTRERWKKERELGKRKSIKEVSESERSLKRQQWRRAQARRRARKKATLDTGLNISTSVPIICTIKTEEEHIAVTPMRYKCSQESSTNMPKPAPSQCKETQTPDNICAEIEMTCNNRGISRKRPRWESIEEWAPIDSDISLQSKENTESVLPPKDSIPVDIEFPVEERPFSNNTKYIVYESCLRQLFNSCPVCSMPCEVKGLCMGTYISFDQHCPHCNYSRDWKSQPVFGSTPLGNLQMSAAIYFTGLSFHQVEKFCKALQLQSFNYDTFRKHARNYLEPAIVHKWKADQQQILDQLKEERGKLKVSGDMWTGRAEGYGCYTLTHQDSNTIVDLQLVQNNKMGKGHLKADALKQCLDRLSVNDLEVDSIVTKSCPKIQEFLKKQNITHFYDTQHFEKRLSKRLVKLSRHKDCAVLKKWLRVIKNHLYWSVTFSTSGGEKVAKWTSLINHMQNIHQHQNPLYPMCTYLDIKSNNSQKWLQQGSSALNKVDRILNNEQVLEDIAKLCPNLQTYSMKTFHNLIQEFTPRNVIFPPTGMLCRLYLAAMHHNENADLKHRSNDLSAAFGMSSKDQIKTDNTYNYLDELMNLIFEVLRDPAPFIEQMKFG
ncbi:uncharacterized protein LOC129411969 [Boleophthalmus pectinirostris]|uniref:uncharacterized protein LOC129411969 n=1 Tax=Boleophthalmus pectinirostris TaxID=150288 RepID=UPI0024308E64|nr:uncharacterized protein LOC129411969 [Boleophthalmus pectinirostris]